MKIQIKVKWFCFNNDTIRTVWDKEQEKYFISVVDIKGMLRIIEPIPSKNVKIIYTKWHNLIYKESVGY